MRPVFAVPFVLALMSITAGAQSDPIKARQALMKDMGAQTQIGAAMVKGTTPFDAAKAAEIFKSFAADGAKVGALFPEGSNQGETKALPAVWSNRAGFDAALDAFNASVADNAAKIGTADGFKTAFTAVAQACRACHTKFKSY